MTKINAAQAKNYRGDRARRPRRRSDSPSTSVSLVSGGEVFPQPVEQILEVFEQIHITPRPANGGDGDRTARDNSKHLLQRREQDIAAWKDRMGKAPQGALQKAAGVDKTMGSRGSYHKAECSFPGAGISKNPTALEHEQETPRGKKLPVRMNTQALRMAAIGQAKIAHEDYNEVTDYHKYEGYRRHMYS